MATYTVIQDIEAEDKFVGPLTLKQFIFAGAGIFFSYLCVFAASRGALILLPVFLPPALLGFFMAVPWSKEQPTEVWVLAKLRFRFMAKARIWDQSGMEELVTITAPKKVEKHLTNGLNQDQVQSRLKALAETIDTRGWAIKHASLPDTRSPYVLPGQQQDSQRLIDISDMPREVPEVDLEKYEDVMDDDTPVSSSFSNMIETSSQAHMQRSLDNMDRVRKGEPLEDISQPEAYFTHAPDGLDEQALSTQLHNMRAASDLSGSNMHRLSTSVAPAVQDNTQQDTPQPQAQMTNTPDPDIINLANNNDLDVATISRVAKKDREDEEVVISLR